MEKNLKKQQTVESKSKLIYKFGLIFTILSLFSFIVFTVIAILMEIGTISNDFGPIHRYVTNFYSRLLLYCIVNLMFIYLILKFKSERIVLIVFLLLVTFLIDGIGNTFGWYSVGFHYSIPYYDKFVHFLNSVILVLVFYIGTQPIIRKRHPLYVGFFSFLAVVSVSAIWEIYEVLSDKYLGTYMVNENVYDVIYDMICNDLGALFSFGLVYSYVKTNRRRNEK